MNTYSILGYIFMSFVTLGICRFIVEYRGLRWSDPDYHMSSIMASIFWPVGILLIVGWQLSALPAKWGRDLRNRRQT